MEEYLEIKWQWYTILGQEIWLKRVHRSREYVSRLTTSWLPCNYKLMSFAAEQIYQGPSEAFLSIFIFFTNNDSPLSEELKRYMDKPSNGDRRNFMMKRASTYLHFGQLPRAVTIGRKIWQVHGYPGQVAFKSHFPWRHIRIAYHLRADNELIVDVGNGQYLPPVRAIQSSPKAGQFLPRWSFSNQNFLVHLLPHLRFPRFFQNHIIPKR